MCVCALHKVIPRARVILVERDYNPVHSDYNPVHSDYNPVHSDYNPVHDLTREEDTLISTFIIEMACVMLHSLKLAHKDDASLGIIVIQILFQLMLNTAAGTVEQAQMAINHIARIIRARSNLLSKPNKLRRVPR